MDDKKRKKVTVAEAAEYLGLTPGKVQDMVERGVLKADKFAGAIFAYFRTGEVRRAPLPRTPVNKGRGPSSTRLPTFFCEDSF